MKLLRFLTDAKQHPIPVVDLSDSQNVDGSSGSAQSTAIDGTLVRIVAYDADIRIAKGVNPTAVATSILIPVGGELWLPIKTGSKIAVLGGKANICTAGDIANA